MKPDGEDKRSSPQTSGSQHVKLQRGHLKQAWHNLTHLHGSYRYGLVLMLTLLSTAAQMLLPGTTGSRLLQSLLLAGAVITALFAEGATRRQRHRWEQLVGISVVALVVTAILGQGATERTITFGLSGILAIAGTTIVARGVFTGIRVEHRVTLHSVMGALTVYLLSGLVFAFVYSLMDAVSGSSVLSHIGHDRHSEEVYFSFITLTTVGYGDIVPTTAGSRMTAVLEALFGQLYLVTIVAVIVSNVGARGAMAPRPSNAAEKDEPPAAAPAPD
jgi:voltage-gated potassium channel